MNSSLTYTKPFPHFPTHHEGRKHPVNEEIRIQESHSNFGVSSGVQGNKNRKLRGKITVDNGGKELACRTRKKMEQTAMKKMGRSLKEGKKEEDKKKDVKAG